MDHLNIAQRLANKVEEARAYSNRGSSHHFKRNFEQAITYHNHVLRLAHELKDHTIEARAYAGLGHAGSGDVSNEKLGPKSPHPPVLMMLKVIFLSEFLLTITNK